MTKWCPFSRVSYHSISAGSTEVAVNRTAGGVPISGTQCLEDNCACWDLVKYKCGLINKYNV